MPNFLLYMKDLAVVTQVVCKSFWSQVIYNYQYILPEQSYYMASTKRSFTATGTISTHHRFPSILLQHSYLPSIELLFCLQRPPALPRSSNLPNIFQKFFSTYLAWLSHTTPQLEFHWLQFHSVLLTLLPTIWIFFSVILRRHDLQLTNDPTIQLVWLLFAIPSSSRSSNFASASVASTSPAFDASFYMTV